MTNKRRQLLPADIAFMYAVYFLLLLITTYTIATIGFFAGLRITAFYFPAALVFSGMVFFFQLRKTLSLATVLCHLVFIHLFLLAIFFICIFFFDTSYDGLWYHQPAIVRLANGWNPVYGPFYTTNEYDKSNYIWIQHYPKASWMIAACIYKLTGMVESAKMINFIVVATVFFYSYAVFTALFKDRRFAIIIFSLLVSFNPIATSQLFSDYVDGVMAGIFSLIFLALIDIEISGNYRSKWKWFMLLSSIIIITNLKFTGLFMGGILMAIFSIYWWWKKEPVQLIFKKYILIGAVAVLAIVFFGFNPYVTNTYYKHHVFYPLNEKATQAIVLTNQPDVLNGKNNFTQLFISIFSVAENNVHKKNIQWKNPFSITKDDIKILSGTDIRLGGFGPLFLLAFLLSVVTAILFFRTVDKDKKAFLVVLLAAIFFSVVFAPLSWWARYTPQFFLIPVILTAFSFYAKQKQPTGIKKYLPACLLILLSLNIFLIGGSNLIASSLKTSVMKQEMKELKLRKEVVLMNFSKTELQGVRTRLNEAGVHFIDSDTLKTNVQELHTSFYTLYGMGPVYNKVP